MYKDTLLIFSNRLFVNLSLVLGTYLFAHQLQPADFGGYQNFWTQFNTFFAVAGLGLASFIFSYTPVKVIQIFRALNTTRKVLGIGLIIACAFLFGGLQQKAGVSFTYSAVFLVFNTLSIFTDSFLTIFKKYKVLVAINLAYFLFFTGFHLFAIRQAQFNFDQLILSLCGLVIVKCVVSFFIIRKLFREAELQQLEDRKYLRLWTHIYLFDLVQILIIYLDKFIVSVFTVAEVSVIYQNGTYPIPIIPILFTAVSSVTLMRFSTGTGNEASQAKLLSDSGKALSTAVFPVFFFFLFFANEFIQFYFSDKYLASVPIFRMSLLMLPFKAFNFTLLFQRKEMGSLINKGVIIDVVTLLLLVFPLYKILGLKGIPLSYALATLVQAGFYIYHHKKVLTQDINAILPLKDWARKALIFGSISFVLHYVFSELVFLPLFWTLAISFSIIAIIAAGFLYKEIRSNTNVRH
ncbi:MAG: hypothetical protein EOP54_00355 [Sphingobacteriales bacterium]|nr:MAG: hypothetical protein EOP54_00355 [Sphingobacteriales bacterium]